MRNKLLCIVLTAFVLAGIMSRPGPAASFGDDFAFLKQNTEIIVMRDRTGSAQVAVAPACRGVAKAYLSD